MFCLGCQAEEEEEGKGEEPEEGQDKKGNQALHQEKVIFPPFLSFLYEEKKLGKGTDSFVKRDKFFFPFVFYLKMKKETNLTHSEKVNPSLFCLFTQEKWKLGSDFVFYLKKSDDKVGDQAKSIERKWTFPHD